MYANLITHTSRQRGSTLLISLGVLTAITVGATVAMQQSTTQVRMVTNMNVEKQTFAASYSHLTRAVKNLGNSSGALLTDLITRQNASIAAQKAAGIDDADIIYNSATIDAYTDFGWQQPDSALLNSVGDTQVVITYPAEQVQQSNTTPVNPKDNEGSSSAASSVYPFVLTATTASEHGNITSTQQIGIKRKGASAQ
ncbi:pilus assembly PilX family protein [Oceanobacter antarcticus]|jgi:hypothetical protein|uniref:Type 4 fimbrial biogenesis protein PilX N-terminal domain-containing protein n=2 Tax=Oceanospirillaceae TaxID=135620 RepID=A0ABW8NES0_9GAMM|tara:strand:- start:593 stop:1183 length:591 start_codon:yes stop_codon:yes gene_type:complete